VSGTNRPAEAWPELTEAELATLARFGRAHDRLDLELIRPEQSALPPVRSMARWAARMDELRSFMAACGDPQRSFRAVHVTGTSGKGSVATIVARALHHAGYRVGLHTSPYLQSPTEKNWIAGRLMSPELFAELVDWVWPVARPRRTPEHPASIHGMASVAIALEAFRRERVDVAVVEAGCGGRFDLTNVLETALAVVTTVGWDHVQTLGPTLDDIAWHKAGVMKAGAPAVTGVVGGPLDVIRAAAGRLGVELTEVQAPAGAPFWEANAAIARAALAALPHELHVPDAAVERAIASARLPARREDVPEPGRRVILDGAHNPEKMAALVRTLEPGGVFVLGCLSAKDARTLVETVAPAAARVVATEPEVYSKPPTPARTLAALCSEAGVEAVAEPSPRRALELALELAAPGQHVVVTGSLYMVGDIRDRWYPTGRVVLHRTSWPRPASST
jgi:dihydrofolate synthase/folylpolyglutamate synthase